MEELQNEKNSDCSDNKKISLEEKFANYKGENLAKEFEWDNPKGKEIW